MIHTSGRNKETQTGFSMIELLVVVAIIVVVGGMTLPGLVQTWYDIQLRSAAAEVADLMQRSRIQAARANISPGVSIRYQVQISGGPVQQQTQQVYADLNNSGTWDPGEPIVNLPRISAAAGAPNGANGAPPPFVDTMDTTSGPPCDNTCTLGFSPRGLPCKMIGTGIGAPCTTPAASYFVYYFQDNRPNGWSAVLVSKAGRTKTLLWNGSTWR